MAIKPLPFDVNALRAFLAVCENGSMAAAGRHLGITQPAVSQTIADLEAGIGSVLFDRAVRPLALTAAGTVLRQFAENLISDMAQISGRLREMQRGRVSHLRIGIVDSLSRAVMQETASFMHGRVEHLVVLAGLTESHATALLTRKIDFILGVDDLEDVAGLERWPLFEEPYFLVCPDTVKAPKNRDELEKTLTSLPFIRFTLRSRSGAEIERFLRRVRIELPAGQEFDLPQGVLAGCRNGGVAISTPLCLSEAGYEPGMGLAVHPLPLGAFRRRLTLVARRREFGRLPLDFAETLRAVLKEECLPLLRQRFAAFADEMTVLT
ncbi:MULTISPECIES: LysR family transcriptional regulator [Acetobacter]|uniref:LysR family transcriptional regulator n=2 Tax=Acetobacter thailandicus TaxID=1502842 RepID=A0ABT3QC14_9PROT|nr:MULTISPECIES: LysR family transcriptional regulator [Acetobacter]MBS0958990.1 LysR family transcriptional regulator [Acetobacter thailandicus]MBS0980344.1 LysR family transcriptional regulator [Acetobacter thailandicus]MBS0985123.1 LysR family transcriptional regulator [Acetobacter thailandicus]MBS1003338.1 LysR family transcriptional regulator [Acetobacter thailandicus]MCX2562827.1 LysR family transcriptional regulator [Acetobacter thailandicus]